MRLFLTLFIVVYFFLSPCSSVAYFVKISNKNPSSTPTTQNIDSKIKFLQDAIGKKNHKAADRLVDELLRIYPDNPEYIKIKIDTAFALKNYSQAILYQEKLNSLLSEDTALSLESAKNLAFCYSQTKEYQKALEIIKKMLASDYENKELRDLAIEYAMAQKNWSEALTQVNKRLELEPNSEKLLKIKGDLCAIQKDFINAIIAYEKLLKDYSKAEYATTLANLYQANNDFASAEKIIAPLCLANPKDKVLTDMYLNVLLAQKKLNEAYKIIKERNLTQTPTGYRVLGDMAIMDRQFQVAQSYFEKLMPFNVQSEHASQQLAKSYRGQKKLAEAERIYKSLLTADSNNIEAKMGLGYVEMDRRNFVKSREYFNQVLKQDPKNPDAKMGIVYSYIGNEQRLRALEELSKLEKENLPNFEEINLTKAQVYYDMCMPTDSKKFLTSVTCKDGDNLKYKTRRDDAITITPIYSSLIQTLAENYKLDINRFGTTVSQNIDNNLTIFTEYNIYIYSSGQFGPMKTNQLNNVTNELKGGVYGRPAEKTEFRADFGSKFFEFGGGLLITDSWLKHYFNDFFSLKLGVKRNNIEQSYLSAVGFPIDGVFTGRAVDNKLYADYDVKLPKDFYAFGRVSCGVVTAQRLDTNVYAEGMVGIGKLVYNNPENKWIKTVNVDAVSYNSSYHTNLLTIRDSKGEKFGGYFSPSFFNANTINIKAEGQNKKLRLKYGFMGFAGPQVIMTPDDFGIAWSFSPYASFALNDHVSINASYTHYNYGDLKRDALLFSATIRGFKNARRLK